MAQGFRRTATGFRAWVRVSSRRDAFNEIRTKSFPPNTPVGDIRAWRDATRRRLQADREAVRQRLALVGRGTKGTFRHDAAVYLEAVRAMTTYADRARDIARWVDEFGDRPRASIQPHEIRAVRDRWLTVGPTRRLKKVNGVAQWLIVAEPLSASAVNHRLRALSNVWTVLDTRRAENPVRDVPEADEPTEVPRAIDYDTIRQIVNAMADRGRAAKGGTRPPYSLAKVRARVMAWTGITPKELALIDRADIQWSEALLIVSARRKGRGAPGRIIPLGPDALDALRDFDRVNAYGRFSGRAVLRAWQLACRHVLGRSVRLYDLRHSFVTGIVRATKDLATAQLLAGHQDARTTRRYALAAVLPTLRAGMEAFTQSVTRKDTP